MIMPEIFRQGAFPAYLVQNSTAFDKEGIYPDRKEAGQPQREFAMARFV
jgi:hypothetical protein